MKGRPKLALETAVATGATVRNPERYRASIDLSHHMLGPPSPMIVDEGLTNEWFQVTNAINWLTEADRPLVELACKYRANRWQLARRRVPYVDDNGDVHPDILLIDIDHKATVVEIRILEKLGCTPTSRPKVTPANGKSSGRRKEWW